MTHGVKSVYWGVTSLPCLLVPKTPVACFFTPYRGYHTRLLHSLADVLKLASSIS
jgi:hypothetical protein